MSGWDDVSGIGVSWCRVKSVGVICMFVISLLLGNVPIVSISSLSGKNDLKMSCFTANDITLSQGSLSGE